MSPEEKEHYPVDDGARDLDMSHVDDERRDEEGGAEVGAGAQDLDDSDVADAASVEPFDDVPMRLGFDLGARAMALGEVRRLRPGQTLVLQCESVTAPVSIRANGQCIGHGELVEIDGRLGVRIVHLRRAPP